MRTNIFLSFVQKQNMPSNDFNLQNKQFLRTFCTIQHFWKRSERRVNTRNNLTELIKFENFIKATKLVCMPGAG